MTFLSEADLEDIALSWFEGLGYAVLPGGVIAPGEPGAERNDYTQVVLASRLSHALERLNPGIPAEALELAARKVVNPETPSLVSNNHAFHRMVTDGVGVEYKRGDGSIAGDSARIIDLENPENNDWLAVNQYTVKEGQFVRRPDVVVFVNGLPLAVMELKNPADEDATIWTAWNQLQTYKDQIGSLFTFNQALMISDGLSARIGSLTAGREWFMPWRTIEGERVEPDSTPQLEVLVKGVFEKRRFLDFLKHFIVFEGDGSGAPVKKIAGYHQYHAVRTAVDETVRASRPGGDRRCGVVWHTQGSGKSLTMAFFAGKVIQHPAMENPTLVVITDRNDLDNQLFDTFSRCHELLRQKPVQAQNRDHLRELLKVASGGVVFTTVHKFFPADGEKAHPLLSDRGNIVVIADEAHRSQYDFIDGFAKHMRDALPKASFIGFTGTPIELADKNTRAVFGDYISVYDIQRAVLDKATVPIYYESRLVRIDLDAEQKEYIDEAFEEVTEDEEETRKEKLKTKWAALEAVVGSEKRINQVAWDLVTHFEARREALEGKGMIVCMSRRICVELYNAIIALRPEWHGGEDAGGFLKIVMTGKASDEPSWQTHIRSKARLETLANRFKDPDDPFSLVIVRDMWLTGFDVPCLHTMYLDKPMRGHGLMQAIARVNRVFRDKPGGLVVDYLGLADNLRRALATYTESGGRGEAKIDQGEAVSVMLEKYEICCDLFHGFIWKSFITGTIADRLKLLPSAQEHILAQKDGKERLAQAVTDLSKAFALSVPHPRAMAIRDDVAFFQAAKAALGKSGPNSPGNQENLEAAVRQIVSLAVSSDEVVDIFSAAGLKKPDISILSDEFLAEVRELPQKNLAIETLRKLLNDKIKTHSARNLVQSRLFSEMLEKTIRAYQNRALTNAQVIEELISLAKEMGEAGRRGENLGLNDDEVAFYDALETNDSAVQVLGDENLKNIARELVEKVKKNATIDWTVKESVRAKLRVLVKRILRQYGYPPDKQEKATQTIIEQAELLSREWAVG